MTGWASFLISNNYFYLAAIARRRRAGTIKIRAAVMVSRVVLCS